MERVRLSPWSTESFTKREETISCESEPRRRATFRMVLPGSMGPVDISPSTSIFEADPSNPVESSSSMTIPWCARGRAELERAGVVVDAAIFRDRRGGHRSSDSGKPTRSLPTSYAGLTGPNLLVDELRQRQCPQACHFHLGIRRPRAHGARTEISELRCRNQAIHGGRHHWPPGPAPGDSGIDAARGVLKSSVRQRVRPINDIRP